MLQQRFECRRWQENFRNLWKSSKLFIAAQNSSSSVVTCGVPFESFGPSRYCLILIDCFGEVLQVELCVPKETGACWVVNQVAKV